MMMKRLSAAAVVLATANLASAQTFTACNPLDKKCPDDVAIGREFFIDYTKGPSDLIEFAAGTTVDRYDPVLGAEFTISKEGQAPTVWTTGYMLFGKVSVVCRAAQGVGVVSSIVLQSEDLDEIDWEWLGGNSAEVQTNYFAKGDDSTWDRGATHKVDNPQENFHNYTIDWTPEYLRWYIDDVMVRELTYANAKGGENFPQTPSRLRLGSWVAGGKDAPEGRVQWAGGYTDFSKGPFHAYYKSIYVSDYHKGATKYVWPEVPAGGRGSGKWQDIKVIYGGDEGNKTSTTSAPSSKTTSAPSNSTTAPPATTTGHGNSTGYSTGFSSATTTTSGPASSGSRAPAATTTGPSGSGAIALGAEWLNAAVMGAGFLAVYFAL